MRPFTVDVPEAVLDDLKARLARTRLPAPTPGSRWSAGTDPDYLRELLDYWAHGFDWRARERWLNSFPHHLAEVGGQTVHFVHVPGARTFRGPAPVPLVLTHGWPYSFVEMLAIVPLLTDPAAHGGDPRDAFDVVVPSLPGYGFSTPSGSSPVTGPAIAELWAALMSDLGYDRFGTYGEDVGSSVSHWLAAGHPDKVIGIHVAQAAYPPPARSEGLTAAEQAFLAWAAAKWEGGTAYAELQSTRPDTLAAALLDSPSGLAAWLVEKFREWSDCDGDLERRFSKDDLLTTITLYWATGTIGSSFRPYFDQRGGRRLPLPVLAVPAGITVGVGDLGMPRSLAERTYADIRYWHALPAGGHFVAKEEPALVAADLREFFRPLREHAGAATSPNAPD